MKRNHIETVIGAVVIVVAVVFFAFSYSAASVGSVNGYSVTADFSGIGGLSIGDSVQISGVKVGTVSKITLRPEDYRARVTMSISDDIKLPDDSSALISSESLLGGKYMELQPGASDEFLGNDGHIAYTQAPQNLEQLLGKFIFSMDDKKGDDAATDSAAPEAVIAPTKPAPAVEAAPETP